MGIYLPYHCFSRLCRKLAEPWVINRVEQVSGNRVKGHRCFASISNKKDTPRGVFFITRYGSENQPLEIAATAAISQGFAPVQTSTSTISAQNRGSIPCRRFKVNPHLHHIHLPNQTTAEDTSSAVVLLLLLSSTPFQHFPHNFPITRCALAIYMV